MTHHIMQIYTQVKKEKCEECEEPIFFQLKKLKFCPSAQINWILTHFKEETWETSPVLSMKMSKIENFPQKSKN